MRLVEGVADVDDVDAFVAWLGEVAAAHDVTVQAFDARYVVSRRHLERAVELADRARERGENVARDRGVEILLYAAGRRQIDQALELGVSEGRCPVVVLVDADAASGGDATGGASGDDPTSGDPNQASAPRERERDAAADLDRDLDPTPTLGDVDGSRVRAYFDVGDAELAAVDGTLEDLVLERVALLDVEK